MSDEVFQALWVEEQTDGSGKSQYTAAVRERRIEDLPDGELLIRVHYSSLNYKDAMSARGNKGVTRNYPHTPGIDAAGEVVSSDAEGFSAGDQVVVIGYDLGMDTPGGFGQYIRIPGDWAVKLPKGLSMRESMIVGTAGFTAALCVEKLLHNGLEAGQGPVLVSGATGGVGSFAVMLLARQGISVTAVTGKRSEHQFLRKLGAAEVVSRESIAEENRRPLLREQWAGAVDVVGGSMLSNILKSLRYGASVSCCGLVGSPAFETTVLPFILRGVNLLGVDSVNQPLEARRRVWEKLAGEWKPDHLEEVAEEIGMDKLMSSLERIYHGQGRGRTVLNLED